MENNQGVEETLLWGGGFVGNSIRLDASNICQLKCPICPNGKGLIKNNSIESDNLKKSIIGLGYLRFKDFKKFVNDNSGIKNIELSNYGEIFLNPELKYIIKYAYDKKINLFAMGGVNLNNANKEVLEYLVKYKFNKLSVSIDGATDDTYKIYRRGGSFNEVIKNIKIINHYKKIYNSKFPKLNWQFIVFGHNEHELHIARKMARNLGMDFYSKLSWNLFFSPIKNKKFVSKEMGKDLLSRSSLEKERKKYNPRYCSQLWHNPQINWDGKLLGCCVNYWGDFGNVFELGLDRCIKSEKYIYAKKMLMGRVKSREDIPCSRCSTYKKNLQNPLKKEDIIN